MSKVRRWVSRVVFLATAVLLAGCATGEAVPEPTSTPEETQEPTQEPTAQEPETPSAQLPTVPGYGPGEVPAIPLIDMPPAETLSAKQQEFEDSLNEDLDEVGGLSVKVAYCNDDGSINYDSSAMFLYGEAEAEEEPQSGNLKNENGDEFTYAEEYSHFASGDGEVTITVNDDGSGSYARGEERWSLFGGGGGSYESPDVRQAVLEDGSGNYETSDYRIWNGGDGQASYTSPDLEITNLGDGTALVNGEELTGVDPAEPVPLLGDFPPLQAFTAHGDYCGVLLTMEAAILFDPDEFEVHASAEKALDSVAGALAEVDIPTVAVHGHTDDIGGKDHNQELSEQRAKAVATYLTEEGVSQKITETGFGQEHPIAPNEISGTKNPAGMEANRRVEVFLPNE